MARKILIIDHNTQLLGTVRRLLESVGYQVACAHGAGEALALAREARPDLIIMDTLFAGPAGAEGAAANSQLGRHPELRNIPLLILTETRLPDATGSSEPRDTHSQVQMSLEKPFKPERLLSEIDHLLALHASIKEKGMGRILVVDDDPDFVNVTTTILRAAGYETMTAANGTEALAAMRQKKPDLVLLDIMMSTVLDGLSVSEEMRTDPDLRDLPVIMISSIADTEYAAVFPSDSYLPMNEWISKPVQPDDLLKKVKRHLI